MDDQNPLPEPLRGNELGTFTHHSVAVRLPDIGRRVIADNELDAGATSAMEALIEQITSGVILPLHGRAPGYEQWDSYVEPHLRRSWRDVPWFFAEYYFYRRILEAVGYWDHPLDPYAYQKRLGLEQALPGLRQSMAALDEAYAGGTSTQSLLFEVLGQSLWGNRVDLSLWPAEAGGIAERTSDTSRLLIDDRAEAVWTLHERLPPPNVDIVLDNVGSELLADLVVADLLLRSDLASLVRLHAKAYPIFVSDATESDVAESIDGLAADDHPHLRSVGERLRAEIGSGRLIISAHPYWVSPLGWRDRPADLDLELSEAGLIIVKGDANYRRLLDDRHWDFTTAFSTAVESTPAPLLALRAIKSEIAAGLDSEAIETAAADAEWLQNGQWAMASLAGADAVR
ncbi:MAG: protein-glutamate O-methyltransferase family protein [bacterium]|nr:protein-glutamate O-methyltransferase family protein [bacterium]